MRRRNERAVILAELDIRHTRRHMPTRRVALAGLHLPMGGSADGLVLLDALLRTFLPLLDEEDQGAFAPVMRAARSGALIIPGISMRYRLQTDRHGLDRSRHRVLDEELPGFEMLAPDERPRRRVIELDTHGPPVPQVLGTLLAARSLPPTAQRLAFRTIDEAVRDAYRVPPGYHTRFLADGVPRDAPSPPGTAYGPMGDAPSWSGVSTTMRWAMEVFGLRPEDAITRDDVQQRFRRLLRLAHPDQGAETKGAAERISELAEAREVLLADAQDGRAEA